jgi:predicted nucleic acid-binding protein
MNADEVSGAYFLDTNVLVYSFDSTAPAKRSVAQEWVRHALHTRRGMVSTQVVQEFLSVALSKFARPMGVTEARDYLSSVLQPLCRYTPTLPAFDHALFVREQTGYSWYDALIVTAAMESKCDWLVSEDLDHGRRVGGVTIHNPFR